MRVLVVHPGPAYSVADVYRGWIDGLRNNGATVAEFNLGERLMFYCQAKLEIDGELRNAFDMDSGARLAAYGLEGKCYRVWPDVVVIVSAFFVPADTFDLIRARGQRVVLIHTESPYEDDAQLLRAARADLNIINDPTNLDRFQAVAPTVYIPHGYDPARHYPRPPRSDYQTDLFFCGTGYPSRIDFLEACRLDGLKVRLGGNWSATDDDSMLRAWLAHDIEECMDNDDAQLWYASTTASLNLYRREAARAELSAGWAVGPREIELAAAGTFFLRESRGEGDELFPMLPTFDGPEDFTTKLRWWLAHDDQREAAAIKARDAVTPHTFTNHAGQLLQLLGA